VHVSALLSEKTRGAIVAEFTDRPQNDPGGKGKTSCRWKSSRALICAISFDRPRKQPSSRCSRTTRALPITLRRRPRGTCFKRPFRKKLRRGERTTRPVSALHHRSVVPRSKHHGARVSRSNRNPLAGGSHVRCHVFSEKRLAGSPRIVAHRGHVATGRLSPPGP